MSNICICCGKKIGLLNGSHLENKLCDNCFFPIGGYLAAIENNSDLESIKTNYDLLITKIHELSYSESGKQYIVNHANTIVRKQNEKNKAIISRRQQKENFKVTTSNNFEGYAITKYNGVVSGNVVLGTGFIAEKDLAQSNWFGEESYIFSDKLDNARDNAISRMIDKAIDIKCNAIVGLKFNYMTFTSNTIVVIVNGTAVEIVEQDISSPAKGNNHEQKGS